MPDILVKGHLVQPSRDTHTHTHTHRIDCSTRTTTVVGKKIMQSILHNKIKKATQEL